MGKPGKAWIIDWTHATQGDPAVDVCQSWLLMQRSDKELAAAYVEAYAKESGREPDDDGYRAGAYGEFKAWCDRYFYLPHRQEPRGVGGIFFDDLASGDGGRDFAFVQAVGEALLEVYPQIVARRRDTPYDDAAREKLLVKRGRYVEFNLVYDRGTKFGFATDADPEAYLMSLPPLAAW